MAPPVSREAATLLARSRALLGGSKPGRGGVE
jgi:hypothetical protein